MKNSNSRPKSLVWLCRLTLVAAIGTMIYVALLPSYFFANWVPISTLEAMGAPNWLIVQLIENADKLAHFFGASIIVLLYFGALQRIRSRRALWVSELQTVIVVFLLGLSSELAQHFIGRNFSLNDIAAGVAGSCFALIIVRLIMARGNRKPSTAKLSIVIRKQPESVN